MNINIETCQKCFIKHHLISKDYTDEAKGGCLLTPNDGSWCCPKKITDKVTHRNACLHRISIYREVPEWCKENHNITTESN